MHQGRGFMEINDEYYNNQLLKSSEYCVQFTKKIKPADCDSRLTLLAEIEEEGYLQ